MRATSLVSFFVVVAVVGSPAAAEAWTCGRESNVLVSPPPTFAAPRNVQPLVTVVEGAGSPHCWLPTCGKVSTVRLRTAPSRNRPATVIEARIEELRARDGVTFRIAPSAPLDANRRYEIRAFELPSQPDAMMGKLLGTFRTGSYTDVEAPTWSGLTNAVPHPFTPASSGPTRGPGGVVRLDAGPSQGGPYFVAFGGTPSDDRTPALNLSYAIWQAVDGKAIDYTRAPLSIVSHEPSPGIRDRLFAVGAENECLTRGYPFPELGRFRIGVKVLDLAGNSSSPSEADVDFGGPTKQKR